MKKAHLFFAIATIIIFLVTGAYMRVNFPEIYHNDETIRGAFRTTHIYILFNGLCHLLLGTFLTLSQNKKRLVLQWLGFGFISLATLFLVSNFFFQAIQAENSLRRFGVIITAIGVMAHVLAKVKEN